MAEYQKLLPTITAESRPYWQAAQRGQLLIQQCGDCGRHQFYRRQFCARCWSPNIQDVVASGKGTVWTYTVTHLNRARGYGDEVPYVLALVQLDEGIRIFTNLVECSPQDVAIGMPVEVAFVKATDSVTIPYFKPA